MRGGGGEDAEQTVLQVQYLQLHSKCPQGMRFDDDELLFPLLFGIFCLQGIFNCPVPFEGKGFPLKQ